MNKTSNKKNRIISSTLITSILTSSCTSEGSLFITLEEENVLREYEEFSHSSVIPMSIKLSNDDKVYISNMGIILDRILKDSLFAKRFSENPNLVLQEYGCEQKIDTLDPIYKIISSLGKDDLRISIQQKDLRRFLELCDKYELLASENSFRVYLDSSTVQTRTIRSQNRFELFTVVGAIAVAVVAVMVVAGVGVAMNVGIVADAALYVTSRAASENSMNSFLLNKKVDALDLYILDNESEDVIIFENELIEKIINQSIPYLKRHFPQYFDSPEKEEELKNLIRINIINNSNL